MPNAECQMPIGRTRIIPFGTWHLAFGNPSRNLSRMFMWQALILGALQGVAELFPVSSLAQTILIPALLGWNFGPNVRERPDFLAFVVALHLATAVALFIYFWKDWREVILAFIGSAKKG